MAAWSAKPGSALRRDPGFHPPGQPLTQPDPTLSPSPYPWSLQALLNERPRLRWLMELYENNYRVLMRLSPLLRMAGGTQVAAISAGPDLHLDVLEQTRYTSLIRLTYYFSQHPEPLPDPDATLRVYHDAAQVEVLDLRQTALPLNRGSQLPTLDQKWRINKFLYDWLKYCASQGYRFQSPSAGRACPVDGGVTLPPSLSHEPAGMSDTGKAIRPTGRFGIQ